MITAAHVITALGSGGAERMLYQLASRTAQSNELCNVVICLSDEGYYGPRLREAGVELHCLGMRPGRLSVAAFVSLVALLRRLRPNVIMTWLYHADLMGTLAGRLAGAQRIIWNIRCSDMNFSHYAPMTRWTVASLVRISAWPWGVATNSHAGQRVHAALGYRPKQWIYLPNGFDTNIWRPDAADRIRVRRELGILEDHLLLGMVARVDPQKDHATFFEAVRMLSGRHPRVSVLLVGKGTDKMHVPEDLKGITVALGERSDVPRLMRALDLLVSSSAYGEGFPNVIGEALASGVPCVATDVGDTSFVVDGAGSIVPRRDACALAGAIARLIHSPGDQLQRLSTIARQRSESEFSIDSCLARYIALLREAATPSSQYLPITKN